MNVGPVVFGGLALVERFKLLASWEEHQTTGYRLHLLYHHTALQRLFTR
jgi:hypothetical protein